MGRLRSRSEALVALVVLVGAEGCAPSHKPSVVKPVAHADAGTDAGAVCKSSYVEDSKSGDRGECLFGAASMAKDTIALTDAEQHIPLEHIIVMMKENRSFDHLFGHLGDAQPDAEKVPTTFSNKDASGAVVTPFHLDTTCVPNDPAHQWVDMHAQVNGGKMDGFVTSASSSLALLTPPVVDDGHFVMGYYDETDLPFYYFLAKTYALADRNFASVRSGTWANRDYLYAATSDGVKNTLSDGIPGPNVPLIFDAMDKAKVSWGVYADNAPLGFSLEWPLDHVGVHPQVQQLIDDLTAGTLPSVVFVDGRLNLDDDHPSADLQNGEGWVKRIYDAAIASPVWGKTALIFTYDEAGGFADHVPPPETTCIARPHEGPTKAPDDEFFELGARVPLVAISPWARRHYVSHVTHQHTSITRLIELAFGLPALTRRDANSDALLDMFDFVCKNDDPIPAAPDPGQGGCATPTPGL